MSTTGMTGCPSPGYKVTGGHLNERNFGMSGSGPWTRGVNLAPDEYYDGCTPLVKDVGKAVIDEETRTRAQYRKMKPDERCFDAVLRCDSDQTAENVCRTLRAVVIINGTVFENGLVNTPEGVDLSDIDSNNPNLKLRAKICSGLGRPTDEEIEAWEA